MTSFPPRSQPAPTKDDNDNNAPWPTGASERTRLYCASSTSSSSSPSSKSSPNDVLSEEPKDAPTYYHLQYDERTSKIRIVDGSTDIIIDSFSPAEDMIGADIQIDFPESTTSKDEEQQQKGGGRGDETSTAMCQNAYLNIYCYPRAPVLGMLARCYGPSSNTTTNNSLVTPPARPFDDEEEETKNKGYRYRNHRRFRVAPCFDFTDVRTIVRALRRLAGLGQYHQSEEGGRSPTAVWRYLVVINPFSGTAQALRVYKDTVRPMLEECGVEHDVFVTRRAGHASERMMELGDDDDDGRNDERNEGEEKDELVSEVEDSTGGKDVSEYHGVIAMGGDGILYELMQTLWMRSDAEELMERLRIGIVGCGTSNGLAAGLLHRRGEKYDPLESTFLICKGKTSMMDMSSYQTKSKSYKSFLTFSWAMIADIDIESECLRWMGSLRNDIWGVWKTIILKRYRARLSYLPPPSSYDDSSSLSSSPKTAIDPTDLQPLDRPVPNSWTTIDAEFILFWASQQTHATSNAYQSPESRLTDGVFQIMIVRAPCSRLQIAKILLGLENASHVNCAKVEFIRCVAYRLEPATEGSFNNVDGEVIEDGPVQAHVLPSAINIFTGDDGF